MKKGLFIQISLCLLVFACCLYSYIDKQNQLTKMRMQIPLLSKEIRVIQEENTRLRYEIDQFESPEHLMELARRQEFSHLKHPLLKEILTVQEADAVAVSSKPQNTATSVTVRPTFAVRAKD